MTEYAYIAVPAPLNDEFLYSFNPEQFNVVPGIRVEVDFNGRNAKGYVVKTVKQRPDVPFDIKPISKVIDKEPVFGQKEYDLALWMEKFYFTHRGIAIDTMIPGGKKDVSFGGLDADMAEERKDVELTSEQKYAIDTVVNSSAKMFYLFGITGSGKTEVFLNCAEQIIAKGGQVIYLVPEITLTHQLALQVIRRFKNNVAILHSALTDAQRITEWRRIKNGEVSLVIGARSAVFAPFENLQMIIIDEEHETSYKSGNEPRYHARQIAQKRINDCGGKLLMGSATPSLEAWSLMKDPSKMIRLDLTQRVGGGSLPKITIADMTSEKGMFSPLLIEEMNKVLAEKKQVILFLNRRGYSYYFHCRTCGYELKCPHCDVAMTYHQRTKELVCHYCGHKQKPVTVCPECGSLDVMYSGFGTEQVEEEISKHFPMAKTARLDTDTVSADRKIINKTLDEFKKGNIDILLGTQMVAKGLNFPNVKLVGIVMADNGLMVPDFRAEERTFDLIVQVSGRSGRADSEGQVIIQTRMAQNPAIAYAEKSDVVGFFDKELNVRKQTCFPPYSRLINIVVRSKTKVAAKKFAEDIAHSLRTLSSSYSVFGAQECPIEKVRENYRYQVLLKSTQPSKMIDALNRVLDALKVPFNVIVEVDVDPLELL